MFKPLTRSKTPQRPDGGFAETQFLHAAGEDDYSGFAPTEMFGDEPLPPAACAAVVDAAPAAAQAAVTALERAAGLPAAAPASAPPGAGAADAAAVATLQWVAAQEARAREAAQQAHAAIAAQRAADRAPRAPADFTDAGHAAVDAPRSGLARLRAAFGRLLPGELRALLPLAIGVSTTLAVMSTLLPLIDGR